MEILYYVLMTYGLTNILVYGKIFDVPRNWIIKQIPFLKGLLTCMMCLGTWVGMLSSFFFWSPVMSLKIENDILNFNIGMVYPFAIFLDAMFTSGTIWLIHTLQEHFEKPQH